MEETLNVRTGLLQMRDDCLKRLVDLARAHNKRETDRLFEQFQLLERAIAGAADEASDYRYAKYKSAILAILAYLDDVGRPVTQRDLVDALLNGGWRRGDDKAETNLKQSIAAFATGLGRKTKQIKIVNGLIGRGEWDKSRFVS
jgi:hypothetical protein